MNYLLNRPNYPFNDIKTPEGLEQMLCDITRQVLKSQPTTENIYDFIATYLEKLLNTRETIEVVEALLTRIINRAADIALDLRNDGLEIQKSKEVAEVIRCYFENFINEKRKEKYAHLDFEFEEIDLILELFNKCKLTEKEMLHSRPIIFESYKTFLKEYLRSLEGAILPPEILDSVMQSIIDRYITKQPSLGVLCKAATTIKKDYRDIVKKMSQMKVSTHISPLSLPELNRRLQSEVVIYVLSYWDRSKSTIVRDTTNSIGAGFSILKGLLEKEDKENLAQLLRIDSNGNLTTDIASLTPENLAALKIQREYKKYRLKKDERQIPGRKLSIVQKVSSFSNLIHLHSATPSSATEQTEEIEQTERKTEDQGQEHDKKIDE